MIIPKICLMRVTFSGISALTRLPAAPAIMLMQTFRRLNGTRDAGKTKIIQSIFHDALDYLETIEETFAFEN